MMNGVRMMKLKIQTSSGLIESPLYENNYLNEKRLIDSLKTFVHQIKRKRVVYIEIDDWFVALNTDKLVSIQIDK